MSSSKEIMSKVDNANGQAASDCASRLATLWLYRGLLKLLAPSDQPMSDNGQYLSLERNP
jgi:hypothetical protein